MLTDPGPFEAFYNSPLQHPVVLWAAGAAAIAAVDIAATIEISVDLADTDTLTVTWTIDAS